MCLHSRTLLIRSYAVAAEVVIFSDLAAIAVLASGLVFGRPGSANVLGFGCPDKDCSQGILVRIWAFVLGFAHPGSGLGIRNRIHFS